MSILFFLSRQASYLHNSTVVSMTSLKHASMVSVIRHSLRGSTWLVSSKQASILLYSRMKDCSERPYLTKMELHKGHSFFQVMFPLQILRYMTIACSLKLKMLNFRPMLRDSHPKVQDHLNPPRAPGFKLPATRDPQSGHKLQNNCPKLRSKLELAPEEGPEG